MTVSQFDIDTLNAAIACGERMVRFADGRQVEYRSVADLIRARDDLQVQLAKDKPQTRQRYAIYGGRGFQ